MWSIPGKPVSPARFQPFEPVDVLYEFDGPRIFTLWDSEGELNLAYWSDEDDAICRYVVVPTTGKIVAALRQGGISVYDALNQPRCWLCDLTHLARSPCVSGWSSRRSHGTHCRPSARCCSRHSNRSWLTSKDEFENSTRIGGALNFARFQVRPKPSDSRSMKAS